MKLPAVFDYCPSSTTCIHLKANISTYHPPLNHLKEDAGEVDSHGFFEELKRCRAECWQPVDGHQVFVADCHP